MKQQYKDFFDVNADIPKPFPELPNSYLKLKAVLDQALDADTRTKAEKAFYTFYTKQLLIHADRLIHLYAEACDNATISKEQRPRVVVKIAGVCWANRKAEWNAGYYDYKQLISGLNTISHDRQVPIRVDMTGIEKTNTQDGKEQGEKMIEDVSHALAQCLTKGNTYGCENAMAIDSDDKVEKIIEHMGSYTALTVLRLNEPVMFCEETKDKKTEEEKTEEKETGEKKTKKRKIEDKKAEEKKTEKKKDKKTKEIEKALKNKKRLANLLGCLQGKEPPSL